MKANFMQHVGPTPNDPIPYVEPEDARPLREADPATICAIRLELARREAAFRAQAAEEDRS